MFTIRIVHRSQKEGDRSRMKPARQIRSGRVAASSASIAASCAVRFSKSRLANAAARNPRSLARRSPGASGTSEITDTIRAGSAPEATASARASKFEPRPERKMASRAGSGNQGVGARNVGRLTNRDRSDEADDPAALLHAPDLVPGLSGGVEPRLDGETVRRRHQEQEPDPAVEDTEHLR